MRKLAVLVIATVLATAYAGAAEKAHRKHAANPPKAAAPAQPVGNPTIRLPVPVDTFRA